MVKVEHKLDSCAAPTADLMVMFPVPTGPVGYMIAG
jgi:hypothetical protein